MKRLYRSSNIYAEEVDMRPSLMTLFTGRHYRGTAFASPPFLSTSHAAENSGLFFLCVDEDEESTALRWYRNCREITASKFDHEDPGRTYRIAFAPAGGRDRTSLLRAVFLSRGLRELCHPSLGITSEWVYVQDDSTGKRLYALSVLIPKKAVGLFSWPLVSRNAQPFRHALTTLLRMATLLPLEDLAWKNPQQLVEMFFRPTPIGLGLVNKKYADGAADATSVSTRPVGELLAALRMVFSGYSPPKLVETARVSPEAVPYVWGLLFALKEMHGDWDNAVLGKERVKYVQSAAA